MGYPSRCMQIDTSKPQCFRMRRTDLISSDPFDQACQKASSLEDGFLTPRRLDSTDAAGTGFIPPPAPKPAQRPPLLRAIEKGSILEVRAVMEWNEEGSRFPFMDPAFEPALCCAVRCGHLGELLTVLLQHGADVNAVNKHGQSALAILCELQAIQARPFDFAWGLDSGESPSHCEVLGLFAAAPQPAMWPSIRDEADPSPLAFQWPWPGQAGRFNMPIPGSFTYPPQPSSQSPVSRQKTKDWEVQLQKAAGKLLCAGADVTCPNAGGCAAQLARRMSRTKLACLVEHYEAAQVYFVLSRASLRRGKPCTTRIGSEKLGEGLIRAICSYLAPVQSEDTFERIAASSTWHA